MLRVSLVGFALLPIAAAFATQATVANAPATISITTVSYPKPGMQVTEVGTPGDLATYYAQHGIKQTVPSASTSGLGTPPSIPPPPGAGDVRPDVGKVVEVIQENGWTSTTTYTRDVQSNPSGGYTDGPWEYGGNTTAPTGGGGCNAKQNPDSRCKDPF